MIHKRYDPVTDARIDKRAAKLLGNRPVKHSKYGNRKVVKNGEKFDSVREYERHLVLLDKEKHGEISNLKRQPKYVLEVNGERIGAYIGDWGYEEMQHKGGKGWRMETIVKVCEDSKGFQTPLFRFKIKLAKALYPDIDFRLS